MKRIITVSILFMLVIFANGQIDMKIYYSADSLVKYLVSDNWKMYFSPFERGLMAIYAEKETEYLRSVSEYTILNNFCVEQVSVFIPTGDETMNYTKSSDLMEFTREKLKSQVVRVDREDDKTLYKLMVQDIPTCFGIAYIKKMNTWSFFIASALSVKRLDTLVSWLTNELDLDSVEKEKKNNSQN